MQRFFKVLGIVSTSLLLAVACDSTSESQVSYDAESYQYKGVADPLLLQSGADRAGPLSDRFDLVQGRQ